MSNQPKTPRRYTAAPAESSPLASPRSSPLMGRRSQYKSRGHRLTPPGPPLSRNLFGVPTTTPCSPKKTFLRERFKQQCVERAKKSRARAVKDTRCGLGDASGSSDGFEDTMEDEEDEDVMQDELFARIMQATERKKRHQYKLSYNYDVGSSFDPDMEDVDQWEEELKETPRTTTRYTPAPLPVSTPMPRDLLSTPPRKPRPTRAIQMREVPMIDTSALDNDLAQIEAYERELETDAEYAREQAAFEEFADVDVDAWSDFEGSDGGGDGMDIS